MSDNVRETFEKIMLESGIDVGRFMPDVGNGCYAWAQAQLDYTRMCKMHQAATAAADAEWQGVVEKLVEAAKIALLDFEVLECHCDGGQCNRCHGYATLNQALAQAGQLMTNELNEAVKRVLQAAEQLCANDSFSRMGALKSDLGAAINAYKYAIDPVAYMRLFEKDNAK